MQTTPGKGKGRRVTSATTPMQTEMQFRTSANPAQPFEHLFQRPPSPRQIRVLSALLTGRQSREQIDRAAGASNGPDVVAKLRRRFGLVIPCTFSPVVDRDGRTIERGTYSLTAADRDAAEHVLLALAKMTGRAA